MKDTQTPVMGITPQVGKRYVTRGGWITPPLAPNDSAEYSFVAGCVSIDIDGCFIGKSTPHFFDLVAEYVEPTVTETFLVSEYVEPAVTDTFRRDLIARLYSAMLTKEYDIAQGLPYGCMAHEAIRAADTLIEAMESEAQS